MGFFDVFGLIILAALVGGASAGLLGVFVVGMRMPFLAVGAAHFALAGAVFGELVGLPHGACAFAGAVAGAGALGAVMQRRSLDPNLALGTLFSLSMGLAFLGIGLAEGPKSALLGLLWGSLLFVNPSQLWWMAVSARCTRPAACLTRIDCHFRIVFSLPCDITNYVGKKKDFSR